MKNTSSNSLAGQIIVTALFCAAGLAALYGFVIFGQPAERTHQAAFSQNYSEDPLLKVLGENGFEKRVAEIAAAGTAPGEYQVGRQSGSPGFYRTEALIAASFRKAGMDVQTQQFQVVVPQTEYCEILDEHGRPLEGVKIYPLAPAGFMPIVLPEEGIRVRLIETESADLKHMAGYDPEKTAVLTHLDTSAGWMSLAGIGVKALIVRQDDISKALRADPNMTGPWNGLVANEEMPFPRFAATGPIEKHAGREVTIRCKVTWQSKIARNVIGVLRGAKPGEEALVLGGFYDSNSVVPDLAPGAEQSLSAAALLEYARALAPYRGQLQRDVIFVATAGHAQSVAGVCKLMEAIDSFTTGRKEYRSIEDQLKDEQRQLDHASRCLEIMRALSGNRPAEISQWKAKWTGEDADFRKWFDDHCKVVGGEINLAHKEEVVQAKIRHLRAGSPVFRPGFDLKNASDEERKSESNSHPLLQALLDATRQDTRSGNIMSLPFWELIDKDEFVKWGYAERIEKRARQIVAHHQQQIRELQDSSAVRRIFEPYQRTLTLNLDLYSGGSKRQKDLAVLVGIKQIGTSVEPQVTELSNAIREKAPPADSESSMKVVSWGSRDAEGSENHPRPNIGATSTLESAVWYRCGRLAFTIMNYRFFPPRVCTPEDTFAGLSTQVIQEQIPILGRALLAVAGGRISFKTVAADPQNSIYTLYGKVYGTAGVSTIVPSHPMGENTFVRLAPAKSKTSIYESRGVAVYPFLQANPYGEYSKKFNFDFSKYDAIAADAARFDMAGKLMYIKNSSIASQSAFRNTAFPASETETTGAQAPKPIHVALFQCAPVTLYDQINPQTMRAFKRINFLNITRILSGRYTTFLEPHEVFSLGLMDGSPENEEIQIYRAFMLNADPMDPEHPILADEPEIYGKGYLAADFPEITFPHADAAASMLRTAEKRLRLLQHYGMADEQMLNFHKRAKEWLAEAQTKRANREPAAAVNAADSSLAYAINNHPVIRSRIGQAVVGILWYLGLLVPFVFFAEKLVFGFPDIRKQLFANGVIFLVAFALLRTFHPAFEMVRSSVMILIGFITLLLTLLVTLMVGGKFKQNIKELRNKEGRVEGADINRGGVIGTAFMLGLNNMRRRKIRTGLTCGTLVLITFVMICFTSVSSDLVDVEYSTGHSPWNGIIIRDSNFLSLDNTELSNIRQIYGDRFPITQHQWLAATVDRLQNIEILIDREFEAGGSKSVTRSKVNAAIQMEWNEPMFSGIDKLLLTRQRWFPRPGATRQERLEALQRNEKARNYVILPDTVAKELGISVEEVNTGHPMVAIRDDAYEVLGIIDSVALSRCVGLDGKPILPYDLNKVQALGSTAKGAILPEDVGRLEGSQVILVNKIPATKGGVGQTLNASCGILFPKEKYRVTPNGPEFPAVDYKEQRRLVLEYLERMGEPAYYAIDGTSYYGSRKRERTFAGLLELVVPILIASLTVFNTMRGSVYERKGEIYVYNAVGIAPNHVFFMFMAEACVYAVMGAMLGYILSQGTGRLLTALHWTGGMNMDYSSMETIYASLAIMTAVLLSTILPARDAAKLASPSESAGWTVPETAGDTLEFNLPFTFTAHDRVAVISYFNRWLDSNGLGSSGPFFCGPPEPHLKLARPHASASPELVPSIQSTVWLKPYDLGVSQQMAISLPTDSETGEYVARVTLTRLSGHVAAWNRTLKPFLGALRKQFLNWRATTDTDRNEMFAEAKQILSQLRTKEFEHA